MGRLAERAVDNHKNWFTCSGAVLCAFAEEAGMTQAEAQKLSAPFAGGRQGKCGAVLAAERVLEKKYAPEQAAAMIERLEEAFAAKNRSVICRELRGGGFRTCRGCVQDSAEILESMLAENR